MSPERRSSRRQPTGHRGAGLLLAAVALSSLVAATRAGEPPAPAADPQRCPAPSAERERAARATPAPAQRTADGPPGPQAPIEITSDSATLGVDGDAALSGDVRIVQGDRRLSADDVEYDAANQDFRIKGTVRYEDPVLRATGGSGRYSPGGGASFDGAAFELPDRPARGEARSMALEPSGRLHLENVWFSTCPSGTPDWRIRARTIDIDTNTRNGTGRDAAVEFKGVPLLYLPYISFPVGSQRKSGFLFPDLGHSNRGGLQLKVPYYLDIAPNLDLTLEPTLYGRRGLDAGAQFRYLTRQQRGSVRVNYLPGDDLYGADRSWVRLTHRAELPAGWRVDLDAQNVSDAEYFEDFAQGREGASTAFLERLARISFRDEHWRLSGEFQHYQSIDRALAAVDRPYARVPRLLASGRNTAGTGGRLAYGIDAELVNFERDTGVTGWRIDAAPSLGLDLSGPGYFLRPSAGYRYTRYDLERTTAGADSTPVRSLPFAALDAGLRLERSSAARRITIEPRMLYLWTPYREQSRLPVFDTAIPDLNFVQLFSTNRYVGADRVSDANQVSVGVTANLFDGRSGTRFLSATVGQAYYFTDPRVTLPDEPRRRANTSDFVAQLALNAYRHWTLDVGLQWNAQERARERAQLRLQYRPDQDRAINLAYRFQRARLEQGEASGAWPIGKRWNLFARVVYDLQDNDALDRYAGLEYRACCWRLRTVARRFVSSRTGRQDTGIYLQLELNGLASVGSGADTFLEQAIRGYSTAGVSR